MRTLKSHIKILSSAFIIGMLSFHSQAAELITFSNGKVADANDVNYNFQELASRISTQSSTPGPKGDKGDKGEPGLSGTSALSNSSSTLSLVNRLLGPSNSVSTFPFAYLDAQSCSSKNTVRASATIGGKLTINISNLLGREAISHLFEFSFTGQSANDVNPSSLIGNSGSIIINTPIGTRTVNGVVTKAGKTYASNGATIYAINIKPQLSQLELSNDYQIFQEMNSSDIIQTILSNAGVTSDISLQNTNKIFDMAIMYNQSPYNYIQQLTQASGIAYFFNGSSVIFTDNSASYLDSGITLSFVSQGTDINSLDTAARDYAFEYFTAQQSGAKKFTSAGYDFTLPDTKPLNSQGSTQPEKYYFDFIHTNSADVTDASNINSAREGTLKNQHYGSSNQPLIEAGYKFNISEKTGALTGNYVATEVNHALTLSADGNCLVYANSFNSMPSSIMFKPALKTPKTKIMGVTSAVVVGPSGETKHTDQYGRIKIQFHWDRQGSSNENSSAWVRVAVPVDRINDKLLYVPLIGTEVLVSFLNGDPSLPVVIGSLYNNNNLPPLALPANRFVNGGDVISDLPL